MVKFAAILIVKPTGELSSKRRSSPQNVMAGLDPAIPLIEAPPCHIIGIAR
jgi:hypothetical protein